MSGPTNLNPITARAPSFNLNFPINNICQAKSFSRIQFIDLNIFSLHRQKILQSWNVGFVIRYSLGESRRDGSRGLRCPKSVFMPPETKYIMPAAGAKLCPYGVPQVCPADRKIDCWDNPAGASRSDFG